MRRNDPQFLFAIEAVEKKLDQLFRETERLRRLHTFPPRNPGPEIAAKREPRWCNVQGCGYGGTPAEMRDHMKAEH